MRTVTIVGVGRVGGALSMALSTAGYVIERLISNDTDATSEFAAKFVDIPAVTDLEALTGVESDLLFITTRDSQIRPVAERIAELGSVPEGTCAFHCSGALSSVELTALHERGYLTASVHPLVSISDSESGESAFDGVYFAVEGDSGAIRAASELVRAIGGRVFEIGTGEKSLYHAAAVVACGHLVALFGTSIRMLTHCGLDEEEAQNLMLPLVESTLANLREKTPADALTGPFARGDVEVISEHLKKLAGIADENMDEVYRILGRESIELAARQGLSNEKISEMRKLILLDKRNPK